MREAYMYTQERAAWYIFRTCLSHASYTWHTLYTLSPVCLMYMRLPTGRHTDGGHPIASGLQMKVSNHDIDAEGSSGALRRDL